MAYSRKTAVSLASAAAVGALIGGMAVYLLMPQQRYHGIPAPLFDQTYFYNRGTVGAAQTFKGVWVDGFEDSRFFPDLQSIGPRGLPETAARLQMDDASRNLIHQFMAKPLQAGCSDVLAITFKGNAVKPRHAFGLPGYIETIYVPTEVLTVKSLRRIC